MEEWNVGRMEEFGNSIIRQFDNGRMEGWKYGRMWQFDNSTHDSYWGDNGRMEERNVGRVEKWKNVAIR